MRDNERLHVIAKLCRRFIMKDGHCMTGSKTNQILKNIDALNVSLKVKLSFPVDKADFRKNEITFTELLASLSSAAADLYLQNKITPCEILVFNAKVDDYLYKIATEAPFSTVRTTAARGLNNKTLLMQLASNRDNLYEVRMEAIQRVKDPQYLAVVVIDQTEPHDLRVWAARFINEKEILKALASKVHDVQILAVISEQLKKAS